jgi:AraC-like DNA-binding protein
MDISPHENRGADILDGALEIHSNPLSRLRNVVREQVRAVKSAKALSQESSRGTEIRVSIERLILSAREELGRLTLALRQLDCCARLCSRDANARIAWTSRDSFACGSPHSFSVPVLDAYGDEAVDLQLIIPQRDASAHVQLLLGTCIQGAASALTERWFRLQYRTCWVVLAIPVNARDRTILLALDRDHAVLGACASARLMLNSIGRKLEPGTSVSAFFRGADQLSLNHRYSDRDITLRGSIDAAPWVVLTTPPAAAAYSDTTERAMLHARPRHDLLRCAEAIVGKNADENGLPPRILRRIEEYIDAHLDSPLNVDDLAASAGISISHFSRCFRISLGLTPHSYVMHRRLVRAQDLLTRTDMSLSDVALSTGFSDQSHFSRRFHEFMGLPPRSFRLQNR